MSTPDRLDTSLEQPFGRPRIPAAAVQENVGRLQLKERDGGAEQLDEIQRETGVVRVEG